MIRRTLFVASFAALTIAALAIGACGSEASSSFPVEGGTEGGGGGGEGGTTTTCASSVQEGTPCSSGGECCTVNVPDGFGPEGFRCSNGAYKSDSTCLPPPAACNAPLTGSLKRGDGSSVTPACFVPLGIVGVVGASVSLAEGEQIELYFERLPKTGEVLGVVGYAASRQFAVTDAGAADAAAPPRVGMRVGRPGGFSGFDTTSESASGTVTVTSIMTDASGSISLLHASVDAQMLGPSAAWMGKLTGTW